MESILVIGAGFMGSGIAQVCAQAGYRVHLMDIDPVALEKAIASIKWSTEKLSTKGLLAESSTTILDRIAPEDTLEGAARAQWVVEAALEVEELKRDIFQELDRLAPADTPLASNTSSIPITRIAQATQHPERVLGLHFFGPVPLMGLVEVVKGEKTTGDVFNRGVYFVKSLGKTPVRVHRDIPCFVMNRIFAAAFREAVDLVDQGIVSPEDVDVGMKLGYGWNAGPFEIADNAGLDTYVLIGKAMKALGEEGFISKSEFIERMVAEGRLGRKVGKGFYRYTSEGKRVPWDRDD
ncbi:MAG: 3-hydroxyacyl-CoA dehydrogenase family protein [Deltaproteobacteria bacterium]|nr:MAG: 3-hydroxyacyl-CoA dehydrogenase family protein [Deltaproteobacteria bacterium]